MRRLIAAITLALAAFAGVPGTASAAAPDPLGGGTILFNPFGQANQCTAAFATVDSRGGWYLVTERECGTAQSTQLFATHSNGNMVLVGTLVSAEPGYGVVRVTNTVDWELVSWIATAAASTSSPAPTRPRSAATCASSTTRSGSTAARSPPRTRRSRSRTV